MSRLLLASVFATLLLPSHSPAGAAEPPVKGTVVIVRDDVRVEVNGKEVALTKGEKFPATVRASGEGFEFEAELTGGGGGTVPSSAAAFSVGAGGACVKISIVDAVEADLVEMQGMGEYAGKSIRVKAKWEPSLVAKLCIVLDRGVVVRAGAPDQDMVSRPLMRTRWRPTLKASLEGEAPATIELGAGRETVIEGYCADEDLDPPDDGTRLKFVQEAGPHLRELFARLHGAALDPDLLVEDVWKAEREAAVETLKASDWLTRSQDKEDGVESVTYEYREAMSFALSGRPPKVEADDPESERLGRRLLASLPPTPAVADAVVSRQQLNLRPYLERYGAGRLGEWLDEQGLDAKQVTQVVRAATAAVKRQPAAGAREITVEEMEDGSVVVLSPSATEPKQMRIVVPPDGPEARLPAF